MAGILATAARAAYRHETGEKKPAKTPVQ